MKQAHTITTYRSHHHSEYIIPRGMMKRKHILLHSLSSRSIRILNPIDEHQILKLKWNSSFINESTPPSFPSIARTQLNVTTQPSSGFRIYEYREIFWIHSRFPIYTFSNFEINNPRKYINYFRRHKHW